MVASCWGWR